MMFLYLDGSALVKRYIDEPHSEAVAHLLDQTLAIGTSAISRVEARMRQGASAVPREEPLISTARTALVTATELPALSSRLSIEGKRAELVRGDLIVMTPAGGRHGQVAHRVGLVIGNHVLDQNLGRVFAAETGFLLQRDPDTVRAPDVAFVVGERLGAGETPAGFLEMAPDLAVEVISPSDSATAVQAKVDDWLAAGTRLVWVVDPETRSVVVHRPAGAAVVPEAGMLDGAPVFSDFSVRVRDLFT